MDPETARLLQIVAYFGVVLGFLGTVAPVVPGPWLVWASALLWAWADGFRHVGWPTLLLMACLAAIATVSDIAVTAVAGRRGGAAWSSLAASGVGGLLGFAALGLPGAVAGSIGGAVVMEWRRHGGDWLAAWSASRGILVGWLLSTLVEVVLVALMILAFTLQAFGPA